MMLVATALASTLLASSAAASPATLSSVPPMIVHVAAAATVPPQLVTAILAETAAIWRQSGVTLVWRRAPLVPASAPIAESGPYLPNVLSVVIGDDRGAGLRGKLPLGWIQFNERSAPGQEIYLSHANAQALMNDAQGVVGVVAQMPIMQRQMLLGRAIGRAFAHELGHYLLASKLHSTRGMMKAALTAVELFMPDASAFRIDAEQRRSVAARLRGEPMVASR
jgi:hypothetical protein